MGFSGQAALEYLAAEADRHDGGSSSHWRHYHREFVYRNGTFSGLAGFGGCAPPRRGLREFAHKVLQARYRRMGRRYSNFQHLDSIAQAMTQAQQRAYDLDVLRQTITLAFLHEYLRELGPSSDVAVIGDGFASMTTLLLAGGLARRVFLINLNKTLLVDLVYLQKWKSTRDDIRFNLVIDQDDLARTMSAQQHGVVAIQAANQHLLAHLTLHLAINIASMQEMDPPVIAAYFRDLRAAARRGELHFYCCNREEKRLPDGTVTVFAEYPWRTDDVVVLDELCPWHQQYYVPYPPFYRRYDGPIRHRLVRMAAADGSAA